MALKVVSGRSAKSDAKSLTPGIIMLDGDIIRQSFHRRELSLKGGGLFL